MPTTEKQRLVAEIKDRLSSSGGVILADYRGLTVKDDAALRTSLRDSGRRGHRVQELARPDRDPRARSCRSMDEFLAGPTVFVFTPEDPVATAKALLAFAKEQQGVRVQGRAHRG